MKNSFCLFLVILFVCCTRSPNIHVSFDSCQFDTLCCKNMNITQFCNSKTSILVFYDSVGCMDCKIHEMFYWSNIIGYLESSNSDCGLKFIVSPSCSDSGRVHNYLRSLEFNYPIFFDINQAFSHNNPMLYSKQYLGYNYLLKQDSIVVLKGNFLKNKKDFEKLTCELSHYEE